MKIKEKIARMKEAKSSDFEIKINKNKEGLWVKIALNDDEMHCWSKCSDLEIFIVHAVGRTLAQMSSVGAASFATGFDVEIDSLFELVETSHKFTDSISSNNKQKKK